MAGSAAGRVTYSSAELTRLLANHERFVTGRGGVRANFKGADLKGAVLANRRLDEIDFTGADLSGANLHGSNLTRASLFCADLTGCNLRNAKLHHADLRGASFRGADLSFAGVDYADLRKATMMIMDGADVSVIDHRKTGLGHVDFSYCSLRGASFGKAKLDGAIFDGALLLGVSFRGAEITNASFVGAVLMDVAELNVPPETFADCVFDVSAAAKAKAGALAERLALHQQWVMTDGREGVAAELDGEDLRPLAGQFSGRCLIGLHLRGVTAIGLDFSNSQLQGARFEGSDLRGADFSGCDLSGASFYGARLVHARFEKARLAGLTLRNGEVLTPNFFGADANPGQFRDAVLETTLGAMGVGASDVVEI
ncbi:pentapeptide repeat-containing protein [Rhizomicrobium electricum]|uniref:pentapeptide repeat-containing protein n=1 Tax=Rhizomicrobium electricum TaxID=480070 RepID=UPI0014245FB5|nr:pentapeptide repeat-containing protein [Rhizomicrobium electricum]